MSDRRNVETLIRAVREELRAEGPDGAGYSDFMITDALNRALDDLSGAFTIRDTAEFETEEGKNHYDLTKLTNFSGIIYDIIRVEYDNYIINGSLVDEYVSSSVKHEGEVREWFLWGNTLTLIGNVKEGKNVRLWVNRAPKPLGDSPDQAPETPRYADEALISYAVSVCYRESKEYERANYHFGIFQHKKQELIMRTTPQGHRETAAQVQDDYWGPFKPARGFIRTDNNPGGRYR